MVERIFHQDRELALVLRHDFKADGIKFFTPGNYSQQLGYMKRPEKYVIPPHVHNPVEIQVLYTKEVLIIKSGRVRVDFYSEGQLYLESAILNKGDIILLAFGGHGFEMLESSEIIEVKQGPYAGDSDKNCFSPVAAEEILIKGNHEDPC